jgi:hypothetical protein
MLSPENMTHKQAVLGALVLALTAPTDAQAQMAADLAEEIACGLSAADIEACKEAALFVRDFSSTYFYAECERSNRTVVEAAKRLCNRYWKKNAKVTLLSFDSQDKLDQFLLSVPHAQVVSEAQMVDYFLERYQLQIEDKLIVESDSSSSLLH